MNPAKDPPLIRMTSVDKKELVAGALLVAVSFFMPLFFTVENFDVLSSLSQALDTQESSDLVAAAFRLVALNSVRGIPHYAGAFFVGDALQLRWRQRDGRMVNLLLIFLIIQATYWGIEAIHGIHYDFGIPAILVCALILVFRRLDYTYLSLGKKALLIVVFLTAFQFLDVMPALSGFPVGRGESSWNIKLAAVVLGADGVLNIAALAGLALFLLFGILVFFQLRDENNLRQMADLREQNQRIRTQSQINEMKNRTYQEVQYLVHDLKSPLTAVQTLVGVMKMKCEIEGREQDMDYLTRIESAVDHMSGMISDILYEDQTTLVTTQAVLAVVLSQSSVSDYASHLQVDNPIPQALVRVNRILFPRALVNLLQNSSQAVSPGREPHILLTVGRDQAGDRPMISFTVSDNGRGLDNTDENVWKRGVSSRDSSGLGLAFVHSVVERAQGEIRVESARGQGTSISILLPEGGT